jgi:class 3 adenylate cyclase
MINGRATRRPPGRMFVRLLSLGDEPGDDDDLRLRKRAGVAAGYLTVLAPLSVPVEANGLAVAWGFGLGLSAFSVVNLLVLARTQAFHRYVIGLICAGVVFVPAANAVGGGVTGATVGLVWAFLVPAYALLALGPQAATPWFVVFLAMTAVMLVTDPLVTSAVAPPPYLVRLMSFVPNVVLPLTIVFLLLNYTDRRRRRAETRMDELLTNAIPRSIAARLRRGEERIADAYPETTVLFADIVGFTTWAQHADPAGVVALLDELFTGFDDIAAALAVEKIKTIGDAYMAVAGAPEPRIDHAEAALALGVALLAAVSRWRDANGLTLEVRVGLASGPVVAGVIGHRRILFDLWGDTVNTASRMESTGVPGRIHVAPATWLLLRRHHRFEERMVEVKGLGQMRTYLLSE